MSAKELFEQASILRNNDQIEEAVKVYQQVKEQALSEANKLLAADSTHMIGVAFSQASQYPEAEKYLRQAKVEFENIGEKIREGAVLRDLGSVALAQKQFEKAKELMQQSIDTINTEDLGHLGITKSKMGIVYYAKGDYRKALKWIQEGLRDIQTTPYKWFESTAYYDLAQVQIKLGDEKEARESLNKALEILDQISTKDQFERRREQIKKLIQELKEQNDRD